MSEFSEIKSADLDRLRLAARAIYDVLEKYKKQIDPLSNAERDQRIANRICLWCNKTIGPKQKGSRGVHEYCGTKARAQEDEPMLIRLNRLLLADKGGRPSTEAEAIETKAKQLRDSNRRNKTPAARDDN